MGYDLIKSWMRPNQGHHSEASNLISKNNASHLPPAYHLFASALAGALTCLATNPFWLIKTRMCSDRATDPGAYSGLWDGLKKTYRDGGIRALYKGLPMSLVGVSHGAVQFMVYEEMKKWTAKGNFKMVELLLLLVIHLA
ncbi:hypothetical protein HDU84_005075 [Entophlyctis sp. JEL0112]|nr:hypothetical protein HDU84_005075 [Entophlyctis sp. JEL0112]